MVVAFPIWGTLQKKWVPLEKGLNWRSKQDKLRKSESDTLNTLKSEATETSKHVCGVIRVVREG